MATLGDSSPDAQAGNTITEHFSVDGSGEDTSNLDDVSLCEDS